MNKHEGLGPLTLYLAQQSHPVEGASGRERDLTTTRPSAHLLMAVSIWESVTLSSLLRFRTTPSMSSNGRCWTTLARALDGGSSSGTGARAELCRTSGPHTSPITTCPSCCQGTREPLQRAHQGHLLASYSIPASDIILAHSLNKLSLALLWPCVGQRKKH